MAEYMSFGFELTPDEADDLLEWLETNDEFRSRLQANPIAALRSVGIILSEHKLPPMVDLPTPQEVAALRAQLRDLVDEDEEGQFWHPFLAVAMIFRWHPIMPPGGAD